MDTLTLTSTVFYDCEPTTTSIPPDYTTVYTTTMADACPTSEWVETYTVTETCTGDPATYTRPPHPPQFTSTVVTCDECQIATQTIYQSCPDPTVTGTGEGTMVTVTTSSSADVSVPVPTETSGPTLPTGGAAAVRGGAVVVVTGLVMLLLTSVF